MVSQVLGGQFLVVFIIFYFRFFLFLRHWLILNFTSGQANRIGSFLLSIEQTSAEALAMVALVLLGVQSNSYSSPKIEGQQTFRQTNSWPWWFTDRLTCPVLRRYKQSLSLPQLQTKSLKEKTFLWKSCMSCQYLPSQESKNLTCLRNWQRWASRVASILTPRCLSKSSLLRTMRQVSQAETMVIPFLQHLIKDSQPKQSPSQYLDPTSMSGMYSYIFQTESITSENSYSRSNIFRERDPFRSGNLRFGDSTYYQFTRFTKASIYPFRIMYRELSMSPFRKRILPLGMNFSFRHLCREGGHPPTASKIS